MPLLFLTTKCHAAPAPAPVPILRHPGQVSDGTFSRDGRYLVCLSEVPHQMAAAPVRPTSRVSVWSIPAGRLVGRRLVAGDAWSCRIAPNGHTLALLVAVPNPTVPNWPLCLVRILDLPTLRYRRTLPATPRSFLPERAQAFSPDGRLLAVSDCEWRARGQAISLYDTATWKRTRKLYGFHYGRIVEIALSPDNRWLAATTSEKETLTIELAVWDLRTGRRVRWRDDLASEACAPLSFLKAGRFLACGDRILDLRARHARLRPFLLPPRHGTERSIVDGDLAGAQKLICAVRAEERDGGPIVVEAWAPPPAGRRRWRRTHTWTVGPLPSGGWLMAASYSQRRLATAGPSGEVILWSLR